jgi:hypothetical protein
MLSGMVPQYIVDDNGLYHNITWSTSRTDEPLPADSLEGAMLRRRRETLLISANQRLRGDRSPPGRFNRCASLTAWYAELLDVLRPSPSCRQIENHTSAYCQEDA